MKTTLSETMWLLLRLAADAPRHGWDGVCAMTAGQRSALRALQRRGLIKSIGYAEGEDFEGAREAFEITPAGTAAVAPGNASDKPAEGPGGDAGGGEEVDRG